MLTESALIDMEEKRAVGNTLLILMLMDLTMYNIHIYTYNSYIVIFRHSRFRGSYVVQGLKSVGEKDVIYHRNLHNVSHVKYRCKLDNMEFDFLFL